jgi:lysophospholipase L1-like esterase
MTEMTLFCRTFTGRKYNICRPRLRVLAILLLLCIPECNAQAKLDTTQFIVIGEGLAAGMADFALREVYQNNSFPAQMARQMNAMLPQPLIQSPGIGNAPGFTALPPRLPGILQGSVRTPFPPYLFVFNLSIPGFRLADSLTRRPIPPLVQQHDAQQTMVNLILGYPALIAGADLPLWTQAEYAAQMKPTFVIVELGYYDVLEPAVKDNASLLPDVATFKDNYAKLLAQLHQSGPQILVLTIPDPFDTAFFTTLQGAERLVGAPPETLVSRYKLRPDDLLTPNGLMTVGNLILGDVIIDNPLFPGLGAYIPGTVVSAATQTAVRARLQALNAEIVNAAKAVGANVYDLQALFSRIRSQGLQVGTKSLSADFLGGFYSLDGYYPGTTGQALIASELLKLLNQTYGTAFAPLDLNVISVNDPAGRFTPAIRKRPVRIGEQ